VSARPIPGYPRYHATRSGRILKQQANGRMVEMAQQLRPDGYYRLRLTVPGRGRPTVYAHRMVATAHVPKPAGWTPDWAVDHIDGGRGNNAVKNLRWLTPKANFRAALARTRKGSIEHAKQTVALDRRGVPQQEIMRRVCRSQQWVSDVCAGRLWGRKTGAAPAHVGGGRRPWKLTDKDVRGIRTALTHGGESLRAIGRRYGVTHECIRKIRDGQIRSTNRCPGPLKASTGKKERG